MKAFFNWLFFLLFIAAIIAVFKYRHMIGQQLPDMPTLPRMTGLQVIIFALSFGFMWVEVLRWGVVKPFSCLKCMTGWTALILAFTFHVEFWPLYLPFGLFVGAVFSAIQMRWL